jgi:hypothetical protein
MFLLVENKRYNDTERFLQPEELQQRAAEARCMGEVLS